MRGDILNMVVLGKPRLFRRGMASFFASSRSIVRLTHPTYLYPPVILSAARLLELSFLHLATRILPNYAAM